MAFANRISRTEHGMALRKERSTRQEFNSTVLPFYSFESLESYESCKDSNS